MAEWNPEATFQPEQFPSMNLIHSTLDPFHTPQLDSLKNHELLIFGKINRQRRGKRCKGKRSNSTSINILAGSIFRGSDLNLLVKVPVIIQFNNTGPHPD